MPSTRSRDERKTLTTILCVVLVVVYLLIGKFFTHSTAGRLRSSRSSDFMFSRYDVTAITHSSIQRLFFLPHIVKRWPGPICITVYLQSKAEEHELDVFIDISHLSRSLIFSRYLTANPSEYPYNKLRNLSVRRVQTSHFWVMDMDIWPSDNVYSSLLDLDDHFLNDEYLAIIIPSFEYKSDLSKCTDFESVIPYIPHTYIELMNCIAMDKCDEFRKDYFVHNYLTSYWYEDNRNDHLMLVPCFKSYKQEPYVVVKRSHHLPPFDERFINYGKDKISWIENLRYDGYIFAVLKGAFAVDIPHPRSQFAKNFFDVVLNRGADKWDMNILYNQFLEELHKKKDISVTYFCDESQNAK